MKAWNPRSKFLLLNSIEQNQSDFEVYFDSVQMLARCGDMDQLERVLEMYQPQEETLRIKVFRGESNRSSEHIFGPEEQKQTGGTSSEFDLKLALVEERNKRERMEDKKDAEIERLREKVEQAEEFINKQKKTLDELRKKGGGVQTGQLVSLAQKFLNQKNGTPQLAGAANAGTNKQNPETEHMAPWIACLDGVDQLEATQQIQLQQCIEMALLDPDVIEQWSQTEGHLAEIERLNEQLEESRQLAVIQRGTIEGENQAAPQTGQISSDPDHQPELASWTDCLQGVGQLSEVEQEGLQKIIQSTITDPTIISPLNQLING